MSKTAAFLAFSCLAALGIVGVVILLLHRPDASAVFTTFIIQILSIVVVAAGTFYALGKTNEKLEVVQKQTNGTLSRLVEENDRLTRENVALAREVKPDTDGR